MTRISLNVVLRNINWALTFCRPALIPLSKTRHLVPLTWWVRSLTGNFNNNKLLLGPMFICWIVHHRKRIEEGSRKDWVIFFWDFMQFSNALVHCYQCESCHLSVADLKVKVKKNQWLETTQSWSPATYNFFHIFSRVWLNASRIANASANR